MPGGAANEANDEPDNKMRWISTRPVKLDALRCAGKTRRAAMRRKNHQSDDSTIKRMITTGLPEIQRIGALFNNVYRAACALGYQLRMRTSIDSPFSAAANSSGF